MMEFNITRKDRIYLLILGIISTSLICHTLLFNYYSFGIFYSDIYLYLDNSLYLAGFDLINNTKLIYGPLICFLTSILIRIGVDGVLSIYLITGILALIGNLGLYLLLRTRFRGLLSFTGVIIYSGFSLYCMYLANGSIDIPAISMTIWTVYFVLKGVEKKPKYLIFASIVFILGFLIRYTVGLIIPVLLMYFIYKTQLKLNAETKKYLTLGLITIAIFIIGSFVFIFYLKETNIGVLKQIYSVLLGGGILKSDPNYNTNQLFYLKDLLEYISSYIAFFDYGKNHLLMNATPLAYGVIVILGIGLVLCYEKLKQIKITNQYMTITTIILTVLTTISLIISMPHILIILLLLLTILSLRELLKDSGFENLDLNLLMLTWVLTYLIFFSKYEAKVNRYILTCAPGFVYFIICAVHKIEVKTEDKLKIKNLLPILLIILFLINSFCYITTIDCHLDLNTNEEICQLLIEYDSNLSNATIGCARDRECAYYLRHEIVSIPFDEIDNSNLTYYITMKPVHNLRNYDEVLQIKNTHIVKHKAVS